ncbi:hypothetical protein B2J86_05705 [Acidovorax sp. SRB_14]|uniref:hypothetical protein n=1 Tax=Acidovorax sp. SRB_14 TaxID=1962699 RepID=UPI001EBA37D0|nr:hypothetical protein [Acidovorax sp. SRB_14]NMM80427.1 hypothetical protein [Acidovorax sp. SRB_14]
MDIIYVPMANGWVCLEATMQSIVNLPIFGLDLAKSVFQLHIVDVQSGESQRLQIKRAKLTEFFAKCQPSLVAMDACGSAHYWATTIRSLGHEVNLLPAQHVKAFLLHDKTYAMNARRSGSRRSNRMSCRYLSNQSVSRRAWHCTACAVRS